MEGGIAVFEGDVETKLVAEVGEARRASLVKIVMLACIMRLSRG